MADLDEPLPGEGKPEQFSKDEQKKFDEESQVRTAVGNVYTFVRTRNINKNISGFTFDHYIDEALRDIRGSEVELAAGAGQGRAIRDAAGLAFDIRPGKLEALEKLKATFLLTFAAAMKMAEEADSQAEAK